ncbi:cobyric acid synthase [Hirschia maritima]|uniref:cobyric acid synthase n=1 Tax=Hirschia maritima TaxID=1121961 RepID=UPI000373CFDA|nr:cobyric acid synthase [Hirschia maritima]
MTAKALMLQGTGSDVGKSVIVAGLCRIATRQGLSVAPFKPQNMSNNAAACPDGGEIGRAQALQAKAAGIELETDFNPVLIKPQSDTSAQILVHGHPIGTREASQYMDERNTLLPAVLESFNRLSQKHDLIIIEGAGSPAENNLRERDIANMGFATAADVPVCLIGDIDKGGVIASLVGTKNVLSSTDSAMIKGFLVNKFRGDPALFNDGVSAIEKMTNWPSLGVIPWIKALSYLPAEDAVSIVTDRSNKDSIRICAPMLSRMANFDDADPLRLDPNVDFQWIPPGQCIPRDADCIIVFGTKSTIGDLEFIRKQGWDHDIIAHARNGGHVLGICGGYQILGNTVSDDRGSDGISGSASGLGLLSVTTNMKSTKTVLQVSGEHSASNMPITGYEIHTGETNGKDCQRPFSVVNNHKDGAINPQGNVEGTYIHGLFSSDAFREAWLSQLGTSNTASFNYNASTEMALDKLADELEQAIDIDALFNIAS